MYIKNSIKIKNLKELEDYIKIHKLFNDFISFANVDINKLNKINELINTTESYSKTTLLKRIRSFKIFTYPSKMQYMYWYIRGFNDIQSKQNVSIFQSNNSKKRLDKYNKREIREQSKRCTEYWIKRGYTNEESTRKVSELQTTFSLEICILNHGLKDGTIIFEERQRQWQLTLNNKSEEEKNRINKLKSKGGKSQINIPKSDIHKENIRKSKIEYYKTNSVYNKGKSYNELFGEKRANEIINKWNTNVRSRKIRKHRINEIKSSYGQIMPNYNKTSISIIEEYGKKYGYNFQHAENGGEYHIKELGYFVDGYDIDKNVVLEIDENYHYKNNMLRKKDIIRQHEIEEFLQCKFIRIKI